MKKLNIKYSTFRAQQIMMMKVTNVKIVRVMIRKLSRERERYNQPCHEVELFRHRRRRRHSLLSPKLVNWNPLPT